MISDAGELWSRRRRLLLAMLESFIPSSLCLLCFFLDVYVFVLPSAVNGGTGSRRRRCHLHLSSTVILLLLCSPLPHLTAAALPTIHTRSETIDREATVIHTSSEGFCFLPQSPWLTSASSGSRVGEEILPYAMNCQISRALFPEDHFSVEEPSLSDGVRSRRCCLHATICSQARSMNVIHLGLRNGVPFVLTPTVVELTSEAVKRENIRSGSNNFGARRQSRLLGDINYSTTVVPVEDPKFVGLSGISESSTIVTLPESKVVAELFGSSTSQSYNFCIISIWISGNSGSGLIQTSLSSHTAPLYYVATMDFPLSVLNQLRAKRSWVIPSEPYASSHSFQRLLKNPGISQLYLSLTSKEYLLQSTTHFFDITASVYYSCMALDFLESRPNEYEVVMHLSSSLKERAFLNFSSLMEEKLSSLWERSTVTSSILDRASLLAGSSVECFESLCQPITSSMHVVETTWNPPRAQIASSLLKIVNCSPVDFKCLKESSQISSCRGQERSTFHSSSFVERATPHLFPSQGSPIDLAATEKSYQISSCRGQERSLPHSSSLKVRRFPQTSLSMEGDLLPILEIGISTSQVKMTKLTILSSYEESKMRFEPFLDWTTSGIFDLVHDALSNFYKFVSLSFCFLGCFVFESAYHLAHRGLSDVASACVTV